ncbi:hypothetical protein IC757_09710 [Wenzhouxiangella sp. AB-CW3]|uniref:M12 family metallo-peptidase n=1 Tax=Wenzhouxiangella sp. AB-CW3 TaxID=2771012 RepID=UPI00168BCC4A|nr:M12 family metallo-peptidase [Wenzhouxiangella sp. AB-CW3]QOC21330.1 hypothetical protein IC757_09710 [Wenzhouxiangella sp. AB-CW3]
MVITYSLRTLLLLFLFVAGPLWSQANEDTELKAFSLADTSMHERAADARLTLQAFDKRFVLELVPNESLWSPQEAARRDQVLRDGRNAFYRGRLADNPRSWARINRIGDTLTGMFSDGTDLYMIDRARGFLLPDERRIEPDRTIAFRLKDLSAGWRIDDGGIEHHHEPAETDELADPPGHRPSTRGSPNRSGADFAAYMVPVTIVTDVEFGDEYGADTGAVVAGRMNFIDGIYESQVGTGIMLWHHETLEDNGSLTGTSLREFQEFMSSDDGSNIPFEGQAHLVTGRAITNAAGMAYVGVTCSTDWGVGVNEGLWSDTISALILAHELGHNFGARHDDSSHCPSGTEAGIMNSMINVSNQTFSQCSLDAMQPRLENATCLQRNPGLLFQDRFQPAHGNSG